MGNSQLNSTLIHADEHHKWLWV